MRALVLISSALLGCHSTPASRGDDRGAPASSAVTTTITGAVAALGTSAATGAVRLLPRSPARAGEHIEIPASTFATGSTPGDDGRDPTAEPARVEATLTAFSMDALPYPNDPALPIRTGVTRTEAQSLCADRAERLCTELEWERACKGPGDDPYPSGSAWDPACDKDRATCASGFGVRAMGGIREWTASHVLTTSEVAVALPAVRGAGTAGLDGGAVTPSMHRCARRTGVNERRAQGDLGFRCCGGPPNGVQIAPIGPRPAFRPIEMDSRQVNKIFATVPELSRLGSEVRLYEPTDVKNILARAGGRSEGIAVTTAPLLWSPENGAELLVLAGRSKSSAFIVALYPLADEKYRLASYFLLLGDLSPIALAYDPHRRPELVWTACWGCAGEQGSVRLRDDHRVVVVQH